MLLRSFFIWFIVKVSASMTFDEKKQTKLRVQKLFYFAYNSYMQYAYPADELMPLSCKGRYRGSEPSRGDVDDVLGNFTLTLIDSLDTLAVLGEIDMFDDAVRLVLRDSRFDSDIVVSVFETNIRILGGLLGGHVLAVYFREKAIGLQWYNNELLSRAKELGDRLLPAFNTTTGIPYPKINLKHGVVPEISASNQDTCTACAGSMILEFAALSRLTGIPVYEEKAHQAMEYLWKQRHRVTDLMGTIINIHNGDWIRRESGVGAGIDSYYEYVLKAYVLLGDDTYLARFNKHYDAVMRYMRRGSLLVDVHMHKPRTMSRTFVDALLAFWPGLQVLKGDLIPAIEIHETLYRVIQQHKFIPEAFTSDFRVHWGHHPLRPEFIESTYFLYKATGDSYYLEVGQRVLDNLEQHARVRCGLAGIKDVLTGQHEDQMDSYVLAETFKYLYLLFSEKEEQVVDVDDFIFTTEAHLLPLSLSIGNMTSSSKHRDVADSFEATLARQEAGLFDRRTQTAESLDTVNGGKGTEVDEDTCPAIHVTHSSGHRFPQHVRSLLTDAKGLSGNHAKRSDQPPLRAHEFIVGNQKHLQQLQEMGIRIVTTGDGNLQLFYTRSQANGDQDDPHGIQFMEEMIELSKQQQTAKNDQVFIHIKIPGEKPYAIPAGPAHFGYNLTEKVMVSGMLAIAQPICACKAIENAEEVAGHVVVVMRGTCLFVDKARELQLVGARGGIVIDHNEGSSSNDMPLFAMSGDGVDDVHIPLVFLYHKQGVIGLLDPLESNSFITVTLSASKNLPGDENVGALSKQLPSEMNSNQRSEVSPPRPVLKFTQDSENEVPFDTSDVADISALYGLVDDQFYSHQLQLHHLYCLQVGSRRLHINIEVRLPDSHRSPLGKREPSLAFDWLPDRSKMITARLTYPSSADSKTRKPALNRMYVDVVLLLQQQTNFNELPHANDYLEAIADSLEAGYFGRSSVKDGVLTLLGKLSDELKHTHHFPPQPDRPDADEPRRAVVKPGVDEDGADRENAVLQLETSIHGWENSEEEISLGGENELGGASENFLLTSVDGQGSQQVLPEDGLGQRQSQPHPRLSVSHDQKLTEDTESSRGDPNLGGR